MSEQEDKPIALEVQQYEGSIEDIEEEASESLTLTLIKTMDIDNPVESLTAMFELFTPSGDEHAMIALISKFLTERNIDFETDCSGNMYFKNHIEGANRFIVNAHMDTVASGVAKLEVIESTPEKTMIKSTNSEVIGGDDKCGVYAVLKLISDKTIDVPLTGLLCVSEECGLVGSGYAMSKHSDYFADCIFGITIDRRGDTDIVTTNSDVQLSSDEVIAKLDEFGKAYGYKHATGSISDISNIVTTLNINGINMAAGYYNAHSGSEFVVVEELMESIDWLATVMIPRMRVYLIGNPDAINYKPTSARTYYNYGSYGHNRWIEDYSGTWSYSAGKKSTYGGYGADKLETTEKANESQLLLEDILDSFVKVIEDVELMNGYYLLDDLAEDATYKLSGSGKSLIVCGGWTQYGEELGQVGQCIDVGYGDGSGDATLLIKDIEDYVDKLSYRDSFNIGEDYDSLA